MDYKKMIIEMVEKIENEKYLKKIYDFVLVPFKRERKKRGV